ncbi:glycosyltransferase family protein [Chryseobacterium sp. CT-SW4]|uniref:glycosyltransferase family protein n=1 Tax=Chryseobacterium sp. SW-1 TaxID=3157343 RepID=UPI003B022B5D
MFSNAFFDYEKFIVEKLRHRGAIVKFYDERPSNTTFVKAIIRVNKSFLKGKIDRYYRNILEEIREKKYDILFLIKGEVMPRFFIEELKRHDSDIQLFYYNYDSFFNNPNAIEILPLFDHKFTFDTYDAAKYNLKFRPLFYVDLYERKNMNNEDKVKNDVVFIGTAHSDRYKIAEEVKRQIEALGGIAYNYYYIQGKLIYWYKKVFDKSFSDFEYRKLSFNKLNHRDVVGLYNNSKCVLDINHPHQTGLTMRTFEALGAGKKLITTNPEVKKYSFYNPQNILVIDRKRVEIDKEFLNGAVCEISREDLYTMSLDGWIDDIFLARKAKYLG